MSRRLVPALMVLFVAACSRGDDLQDYVAYTRRDDRLVPLAATADAAHLDRVERVLGYYHVNYRRESPHRLRIDGSVDRDTLWNFATKAEDAAWLAAHPGPAGR